MLPSGLSVGWALMGEDVVSEGPQGAAAEN